MAVNCLDAVDSKGRCGDTVVEVLESSYDMEAKIGQIVQAIREADYVVTHTGAGISTAAGKYLAQEGA